MTVRSWVATIDRDAALRERADRRQEPGGRLLVQLGGRLVREDDLRARDERLRERGALLLAAGELVRPVVPPVGQPERRERLGLAVAVAVADEPQVLADREVREEVVGRALEDVGHRRPAAASAAP